MTLAIGASKTGFPDYQQQSQPPPPQQPAAQVVVGPLGGGLGGPLGGTYLHQAPPYEQHHHHALHHAHHPSNTPPPSSPSSTITTATAAAAASNCCCPTSSSSSSSPSSGSSAASSRRGSRSSRSSRSGDELGGGGDGSVAWYCCCCCSSPRAGRKRRSMLASVGVCVLVLVYTLLGAFAFTALEGSGIGSGFGSFGARQPAPPDPVTRASAPAHDELRTKTVEKLWSITEDLNILYKDNWTRLAAQEVLRFQDMLVQNIKSGVAVNGGVPGAVAAADGKDPAKQAAKATAVTTAASTYQRHGGHRWTFPSSFLYSLTLITTIGYGSVSPRTTWGRLMSISYAIIGIPLMLLYLSTTGESLARTFRQAYSRMCYRRGACPEKMRQLKQGGKSKQPSKSSKGKAGKGKAKQSAATISSGKAPAATSSMKAHQAAHLGLALGATDELTLKADRAMIVVDCGAGDGVGLSGGSGAAVADTPPPPPPPLASVKVPVLLCLLVLLLYVAAGAFLFHFLEGWTLVEGSYFCFTTLGTIGFGDLIPGRSASSMRRGLRGEVLSVLAASAYILVGMALVAMTFALVQDEFVGLLRRLGRQCSSGTNVQPARPKARPSCSDSESNTDPPGATLSAAGAGETLPMAVVSSS